MTGEDLRQRRAALGLSQEALAAALGTTQNTVSRWETGALGITEHRGLWLDRQLEAIERSAKKRRRAS